MDGVCFCDMAREFSVKNVYFHSLRALLVVGLAVEICNPHVQMAAQTPVTVVIDAQAPGARIPDEFFRTEL